MVAETLSDRLSRYAGILTWGVVGFPLLLESFSGSLPLDARFGLWLVAYGLYGVIFWLFSSEAYWLYLRHGYGLTRRGGVRVLSIQTLLVTFLYSLIPDYSLVAILFIINAAFAAHYLSLWQSLLWLLGQTLILVVVPLWVVSSLTMLLVQALAYLGFQLFALLTTQATISEAAARTELAARNSELKATQALLAESSRMAERVHIARELHDLLGHHLTALSLNLEVASHLTDGRAQEHVEKARDLAKLLLSDVREVVSTMREREGIDLAAALQTLVQDVPNPTVHLMMPPDLGLHDPQRAHVLLRCVQEIITNTVKHAQAQNLWLRLERTPEGIRVQAEDDGRGAPSVAPGNGLSGMRERLESLGGALTISARPGQGFSLDAFMPAL